MICASSSGYGFPVDDNTAVTVSDGRAILQQRVPPASYPFSESLNPVEPPCFFTNPSQLLERESSHREMVEFEGLGESLIHLILSKLDTEDIARVACVNSFFRVCASDELLWSIHCSVDLNLSAPLDLVGSPLPSFRVAYWAWRNAFSMYPWLLVKRVYKCWDKLKTWLRINHPEVADTLRRGVTEEELNEFEKCLGVKLPIPSRVLYRICDGQELRKDRLWGLIGGYSFYDCLVNVYLLPLRKIRRGTEKRRHLLEFPLSSKYLVVAISVPSEKVFFLNCSSGQLYVGTINLTEEGEMLPCVPSTLLRLINRSNNDEVQDGLLLWLEEHVRRLQNGIIGVCGEGQLKSISQFPEQPPMCSTSETNGIQVRASAVFVPEMSDFEDYESRYFFAFSIRMSMLPDGCTVHGMRYNSCQLYWRNWVFRENDIVVDDISAEAVLGVYPRLVAGEKEFVYQSCSTQFSVPGSIEGSFKFVPGRLSAPKGDLFDVEVGRFPLELPEYIF